MDINKLKENKFFKKFSDSQLEKITPYLKETEFKKGGFIIIEGEKGTNFYVIIEGDVEISKGGVQLAKLSAGDTVGEMGAALKGERTATAQAIGATKLIEVLLDKISSLPSGHEILEVIQPFFLETLAVRVEETDVKAIEAVKKELKEEKARSYLGNCFVYLLVLAFSYVYVTKGLKVLDVQALSSTIISVPVLLVFGFFMVLLVKTAGYPLSEYGFNLKNWKMNLLTSFLLTLPLLAFMFFCKWAAIQWIPKFHHLSVISISPALNANVPYTPALFAILVAFYLVFVPVQEIIYRGVMQTTLEKFLISKNNILISILISNLLFSLIHLHLSFFLAITVYFVGLFWGWIPAWQKPLVGPIFSHVITGLWGFYIIGAQDVFTI